MLLSNLHDIFVITNEYRGTGFLLILYVVAFIFLFIYEKEKKRRILLLYMPLSLMVLLYFPVFYHIYVVYLDDSGTYYRMFWLLPMTITIAYGACCAIYRFRRIGIVLVCAIIALCGAYTYKQTDTTNVDKTENVYQIPQYVIDLCDYMEQDIPGVNVYACVPTEMLFYVRQYNPKINLIFGRDAVEPKWGYYNEFYEAFVLSDTINLEELLELTRGNLDKKCTYFVIDKDRKLSGDPSKYGLDKIASVEDYVLYRDTIAVEMIREMFKGTAYEQ